MVKRVDIPRRAEIEAAIAAGALNGAIAAALGVPHADVARVRKILREGARQRGQREAGHPPQLSPESREKKRAGDRARAQVRTGKRHDVRAVALAEESLYRKVAMMRRARVLEMLAAGQSLADMAAALDVGMSTIREIIASLEGRRAWARQVSVQVLISPETKARLTARLRRGEVSAWIARLIVAELDRLDAELLSRPVTPAPPAP